MSLSRKELKGFRREIAMGIKGLKVVYVAVMFFVLSGFSALGADQDQPPSKNETNYSAENFSLVSPPDLNVSSFNCTLTADLKQLQTIDIWTKCTPESAELCYGSMDEFECQLRERALSLDHFESYLEKKWPPLSDQERIDLTSKLESSLRKQAQYLYIFQADLKKMWCFLSYKEKKKFLDSFEDLLKRQSRLLQKFEDFLHKQQMAPEEKKILFLQSFEDLIRRQAILLETFEDFLKVKCDVLEISKVACACCPAPGDIVYYSYNITNKADYPIKNTALIDTRLGIVATGISLGPHETTIINASSVMEGSCGDIICNKAMVLGEDPKGFVVHNTSQKVCLNLTCPVVKGESIKVGLQRSMSVGSERAKAQNVVKIVGDQKNKCPSCSESNSSSKTEADDRSPAA
jgi:hypothetical protein